MSATERLYYHDSRLLEFDARVIGLSERDDDQIAVTLDRTAFYPTGGGQPTDRGTLGEARVVDCIDAEDEGVLHLIQGPAPEVGDTVHGKIDWLRRLDHMQQHTGQHILSAAFVKLFEAPTRSFRVLEHECEIDVELDSPADERIEQAVDLANQIIWESRPIQIRKVTSEEAATLPLRKEPARAGELRLIEIDSFDLTPCGGTHAKSTGEVGVIAVRSWERAKGLTRIQFLAGIRVLTDYRKANRSAHDVAAMFSAGREDSPKLVAKRRVSELEEVACHVEAEELLKEVVSIAIDRTASDEVPFTGVTTEGTDSRFGTMSDRGPDSSPANRGPYAGSPRGVVEREGAGKSSPAGGAIVIAKVFDDRNGDSLKHLALALTAHPNTVALLGSRDGETARLVFARSSNAAGDMNALMRKACELIDGRGGGKPDMAQGGGKNISALDDAIHTAAQDLSNS